MMAGALNLIWGITALAKDDYFAEGGLVCSSLNTWGWIAILIAAMQIRTGALVYARRFGATLIAVLISMCGMVFNFTIRRRLPGVVHRRDRLQRAGAVGRDGAQRRRPMTRRIEIRVRGPVALEDADRLGLRAVRRAGRDRAARRGRRPRRRCTARCSGCWRTASS